MGKLKIKGKVVHPPTLSGIAQPVAGATVRFRDLDVGNSHDTILTKTTDNNGKFSGTSSEWRDTITTKVWEPPSPNHPFGRFVNKTLKDPTDVMMLTVEIEENGHKMTVPFVYLGESVEHKLVVAWAGDNAVGSVNGTDCHSYGELFAKTRQEVDSGKPKVTIKVKGPAADAISPLLKSPDQLKTWALGKLGIADPISFIPSAVAPPPLPPTFYILLGVAAIILAAGGAAATVLLPLAVLYAVHKGYAKISGGTSTDASGNTETSVVLEL